MAQSNQMAKGVVSQTTSNVEMSSDSDESCEEVPLPVVQPKPSTSKRGAKSKNAGKGRAKKATKEPNGEFDLVWDLPDSGNEVTNKCKIGKNKILT